MPVTEGLIAGEYESVLRDSGCSGVVIREALVPEEAWTGENKHCVLLDGTLRNALVAQVSIDTPYYTGMVKAMAMGNPLYDFVVGNISGARDPNDPCKYWEYPIMTEMNDVEIRGQKLCSSKPFSPLSTPDCLASSATPVVEIAQTQLEDVTLAKVMERAK